MGANRVAQGSWQPLARIFAKASSRFAKLRLHRVLGRLMMGFGAIANALAASPCCLLGDRPLWPQRLERYLSLEEKWS